MTEATLSYEEFLGELQAMLGERVVISVSDHAGVCCTSLGGVLHSAREIPATGLESSEDEALVFNVGVEAATPEEGAFLIVSRRAFRGASRSTILPGALAFHLGATLLTIYRSPIGDEEEVT